MAYSEEPTWNLKCIYLTLALTGGYWYLPPRNKYVLLALAYGTYLALAWYDYWYECQRNMGPTYLSLFYAWAKPPESKQIKDFHAWDPKIKNKVLLVDVVILALVLLIGVPWFMSL
jgi:hypothetical protein